MRKWQCEVVKRYDYDDRVFCMNYIATDNSNFCKMVSIYKEVMLRTGILPIDGNMTRSNIPSRRVFITSSQFLHIYLVHRPVWFQDNHLEQTGWISH